jgi:hypothetical protein
MSIIRNFLNLSFVVFPILGMAQNNSFKLTLAPTIVHTHIFALAYERKLSDQFAAGLKVNYGSNDILPYNDDYALGFLVGLLDLEQYGRRPEVDFQSHGANFNFRFFPGKNALNGFYISSYVGYQKGKINSSDFAYRSSFDLGHYYSAYVKGSFQFLGGGIGIGNHWTTKKSISIDVLWLGFGLGKCNAKLQGTAALKGYFKDTYEAHNKYVSNHQDLIDFLRMDISASYDTKGIYVVAYNTMPMVKILNVSLGFSF